MNARYAAELVLTLLAAFSAVFGLATGTAQRLWTVATVALTGVALGIGWSRSSPASSPCPAACW